jgi:hypothetical protein
VLADFVDGANVGMVEGRGCAGFAAETLDDLDVLGEFIGQEFQGDGTAELGIFRFVNDTHASATQFLGNSVVRDGLVDHAATSGVEI